MFLTVKLPELDTCRQWLKLQNKTVTRLRLDILQASGSTGGRSDSDFDCWFQIQI